MSQSTHCHSQDFVSCTLFTCQQARAVSEMSYCYCLLSIECSASIWSVSAFLALWQCLLFVLHVLAFALFERYSIRHSKGIVCILFVYPTMYICRLSMSFTLEHLYGSSILHDPEKYSSAMYLLIFICEMLAYYVYVQVYGNLE